MDFFESLRTSLKKIPKRGLSYYEPGRNDLCVCGSGIKFKKCCQGKYSADASTKYSELYNAGNYEEALVWTRYKLTWYILCHKAHTIPLMKADLPPAKQLLKVDIEALGELLVDLHRCYNRTDRSDEFPINLERLTDVIADERWKDKVIYLKALWLLVDKQDRAGSFMTLQPINMKGCQDSDILTLYLDVCPEKMELARKVEIIDRIITNTKVESYKLQYNTLKGVSYLLVCEYEEGCRIIGEGIERYRGITKEKRSSYGETFYGHALDLLGRFTNNHELIEEAIQTYEALVRVAREKSYSDEYIGDILKCIGESNEALHKYEIAVATFTESLKLHPAELTKVFLARAEVNNGNIEHARELLGAVKKEDLDAEGLFDFAISYTLLAANSRVAGELSLAITLLKGLSSDWPLFAQQRDKWLIDLLETSPVNEVGKFRKLIQSLNRYVRLNPNIFGIGIDFNKIIEDIDRASSNNRC